MSHHELSRRETEILHCMARGRSNKEIGQTLYISENTVSISFVNDLQGYGTPEIDIERFVGDPHGPTTQLYWCTALVDYQFIVFKPAGTRGGPSLFEAMFWR